jgi:enoyl-CoA hydratase
VFRSEDFVQGIHAAIIDKNHKPKWSPERIEDVTPEIVARYLTPLGKDDLVFPG